MRLYVGTSGFSYKEWKGKFYPQGLPASEMLAFYAGVFNAVEINNTFYRMPDKTVLRRWMDAVPPDFSFVLKAPRIITHIKRLRRTEDEMVFFFKGAEMLGSRLAAVLFQLPPGFSKDAAILQEFLDSLSFPAKAAFEFRNASWLDPEIFEILRARDCALCSSDTDELRLSGPVPTASWGYLRLRRTDYTEKELADWKRSVLSQEWGTAFVFFKHEDEAKGPEFAARFLELSGSGRAQSRSSKRPVPQK